LGTAIAAMTPIETALASEVMLNTSPAIAIPCPPYLHGSRLALRIATTAMMTPTIARTPNRPKVKKLIMPSTSEAIAKPFFWPSD